MAGNHGINGTENESERYVTGCRETSTSVRITSEQIIINNVHAHQMASCN